MNICHIETMVPKFGSSQSDIMEMMIEKLQPDAKTTRYIRRIYRQSGIEKRYSVLPDYQNRNFSQYTPSNHALEEKLTGERNAIFVAESKKIFLDLARSAIDRYPNVYAKDITHVITVSCTGFYNPGPDFYIVTELGLPASTKRFHIGFMGCYAAITALKMAESFCRSDPGATVLIVCVELCTLHFHQNTELNDILAAAIFADGGASAIIRSKKGSRDLPALCMNDFQSTVIPSSEQKMAWRVGNYGFDIVLSNYVAEIINSNISAIVESVFNNQFIDADDIDIWAIHPGGRAILDKIQNSLQLDDHQIAASRNILRQFGNMSSPTILFVLKEIMQQPSARHRQSICAIAFGPGLTVETMTLSRVENPRMAKSVSTTQQLDPVEVISI